MRLILRNYARRLLKSLGFELIRTSTFFKLYDQDGVRTLNSHDFMRNVRFQEAYKRGVTADGVDYNWHWRVHVGLWAAQSGLSREGDFVECGVNRGFMSSAIMQYVNWNSTGRTYYLLDTFSGISEKHLLKSERDRKVDKKVGKGFYKVNIDTVRDNFSEWDQVEIVVGTVPESLSKVNTTSVAFLHVDMNCAAPEVAAVEHFWPMLSAGAIVLLDDYGFPGREIQKEEMDRIGRKLGFSIAALPTGQGVIIK